jgi:hypothetical protein
MEEYGSPPASVVAKLSQLSQFSPGFFRDDTRITRWTSRVCMTFQSCL